MFRASIISVLLLAVSACGNDSSSEEFGQYATINSSQKEIELSGQLHWKLDVSTYIAVVEIKIPANLKEAVQEFDSVVLKTDWAGTILPASEFTKDSNPSELEKLKTIFAEDFADSRIISIKAPSLNPGSYRVFVRFKTQGGAFAIWQTQLSVPYLVSLASL